MARYRARGNPPGVPAGTLILNENVWCVGISAYAAEGVLDATVQVNGDEPVPVPPGGATNLSPPLGTLHDPTIVFVNTSGYGYETVG
ncbi:MAG: hypothetical protein AMXMBFR56_68400 [Polyangiaceae bacterium]